MLKIITINFFQCKTHAAPAPVTNTPHADKPMGPTISQLTLAPATPDTPETEDIALVRKDKIINCVSIQSHNPAG